MHTVIILQIDTCVIEKDHNGVVSWPLETERKYRIYESLITEVTKEFATMLKHTKVEGVIDIKSKYRVNNPIKNLTIVIESDNQSIASELAESYRGIMRLVRDVFVLASKMANDGVDPAHIKIIENNINSIQSSENVIYAPKWVTTVANVMRKTTYDRNASFAKVIVNLGYEKIIYSIPHGESRYIGNRLIEDFDCTVNCVQDKQFLTQIINNRASLNLTFTTEQRDALVHYQANKQTVDIKWIPNHRVVDGKDKITNGTLVEVSLTSRLE